MIGTSFKGKGRIEPLIAVLALLAACEGKTGSSNLQSEGQQRKQDLSLSRILIQDHLADPDVLKVNNDLFFLAGTGPDTTRDIPIFESKDLEHFSLKKNYTPDSFDPDHDYCQLWAPDLSLRDGTYYLYFSATRVGKNQACPSGEQPTTYFTTATDENLDFGPPQPFRLNESGPTAVFSPNCPASGCKNAVRIDSAIVDTDNSRWFFYVWFQNGNNISSFRLDDPNRVIDNVGPASFPTPADEEGINEGPDVFRRGPYYYLFFSAGHYQQHYTMRYIMADSVEKLTRSRDVHRFSQPLQDSQGRIVETHGHNSIVERNGEFYNFFHQWVYDGNGNLTYRNTYRQRMQFRSDGTIVSLNYVDVNWTPLPNQEFSLDVVTKSGEVLGPCINSNSIRRSSSVRFTGICPGAGDRLIRKDDIAAFRVFWSDNGVWGRQNSKEIAYDGYSDDIFVDLKDDAVRLNWSWMQNQEYSLDVVTKSGEVIGPCINSAMLGRSLGATYTGVCPAANNRSILKSDIAAFRVFWSDNGVWGPERKKEFPYDGRTSQLFLEL